MTLIKYSTEKQMTVLIIAADGTPATGKTVNISIRRSSDGLWWEGTLSTWEVAKQNNLMTEISDGLYYYDFTSTGVGSSEDTFVAYYQETTIPAYGVEEFIATDLYTNVDAILVDTSTTLNDKIDVIDTNVDSVLVDTADMQPRVVAIETDTNEIQGKLPTNNIMGSSDVNDHDTDIDAILVDTADMQPRVAAIETDTGTTLDGKLNTIDSIVDDIKQAVITGSGTVTLLGSTTVFQTDLTDADDFWNNQQILMVSGSNAGQARRVSDFANLNGEVTVSEAFNNAVALNDTFILIGRWTGAGTSLTDASITDSVWDELLSGHVVAGSSGKAVADIETDVTTTLADTADMQPRVVAIEGDTNEIQGKLPTDNIMGSAVLTSKDDEIDAILVDTNEIQGKLPTDNIMGSAVLTSKDDEIDAILVDTGTTIPAQLTTHDTDIKALIGTPVSDVSTDIASNLTAITSIQNNTRFTSAIPEQMQKPDSSNRAFRWTGNLYDTDGNMEDPANNEILVRVLQADGTAITANLYKEQALTNALDDATDQVNFPTGDGWRAMERLGTGQYDLFYKVASDETEEALTVEFGWDEASVIMSQYRSTEVSDTKGDIEDIQTKVDAMYIKTDAVTPSPTIPAQITTHDTDIKALQRITACPDLMYVPYDATQLNGDITDAATTIPVDISDNLLSEGMVLIGSEYITYTGVSGGSLTGCTRGEYGSSGATHLDGSAVYQSILYPILLVIKDNEGNMLAPDSIPTMEVEDCFGTQELAPTAMTLKSVGIYRYDYIMDFGDISKNRLFKFVTVIDGITAQHRHEVVVIDQIASVDDVTGSGMGDYVCDQDGWYDTNGVKTAWTDVAVGYVRDADTGAPLDDAYVTAYPIIGGETMYSGRPTAQARTRSNGTWLMNLDAATYTFVIEKEGFRIVGDGIVERTVG